jgi:hypothetical protein
MPSSLSETTWVEASRAAHEEGTVPKAPAWRNTVEMSTLMEATGANVSLRADGSRANEARPQSVGAPG